MEKDLNKIYEQPEFVCFTCGIKYGNAFDAGPCMTRLSECDLCGKAAMPAYSVYCFDGLDFNKVRKEPFIHDQSSS